jgi:hypothetical protein
MCGSGSGQPDPAKPSTTPPLGDVERRKKDMKKLVASLLAISALAAAVPAGAQAYAGGYGRAEYGRGDYGRRTYHPEIQQRIDQGVRSGKLTRREADRLYGELRELDRLEARYRYDGLSRWERRDLEARTQRLKAQVWQEKHDWQERRGY